MSGHARVLNYLTRRAMTSSKTPHENITNNTSHGFLSGLSLWNKVQSSLTRLPSWRPSSTALLEKAEKAILDREIKSDYQDHYVPVNGDVVVRTITMEPKVPSPPNERVPLVMIHGFGAGFLQFYKNLDHLHDNRQLLAFDLPGFGRSSRVAFPRDPLKAEEQFVNVMERWREIMGLRRFILLGHSLGGYLATAYAMKHPQRVRHLILVDPWGFPVPPSEEELMEMFTPFQRFSWQVVSHMRPFTAVRAAGPWGPDLMKKMRKDLARTFGEDFLNYVYHCNARNSTGEEAFYSMQYFFGWAQYPMLPRLVSSRLSVKVPITIISGERSWLDAINRTRLKKRTAELVKDTCPEGAYVGGATIQGAGHHLHAEKPEEFNSIVKEVLEVVDEERDR